MTPEERALSVLNRVMRRAREDQTIDRIRMRRRPSQSLRAPQLLALSDEIHQLVPKPPLTDEVDRYLRMATEQRGTT